MTENSNTSLTVSPTAQRHLLMSFSWGAQQGPTSKGQAPVPLEVLAGSPAYQEHWHTTGPVYHQQLADHQLIKSDQHLVLIFTGSAQPLADWVSHAYCTAYQSAAELAYPHLLRTWNYFQDINGIEQQQERYQTFCVARHQVLESLGLLEAPNPAATAIGTHVAHNSLVFLFAKQPGQVIENSRQTPAWQYPQKYSPKQPRFSRAIIIDGVLFCSGTASVVGHETAHVGNLAAQFDECLNNLQVLLDDSGLKHQLSDGMYRFYLRDRAHLSQIEAQIAASQIRHYVILLGDVCRENLLIECEVVFQSN
jgi:chorismate lyase/3-hydroxybenzoate synthase